MGARMYVPILGRFLSVDPVEGGTQNDYVYPVDPVNGNDFSGQAAIVIFGIAIAPVVIVAAVVIGGVYLTQTTHGKQMVRTTGQLIDSSVRSISNAISNTNAAATTATGTAGVAKSIGDGCNILKSCNTKKNNSQQRSGIRSVDSSTVYEGKDASGTTKYVGRTTRNPLERFSEHLRSFGTGKENLTYSPVRSNLSFTESRIFEQQQINEYGLNNLSNQRNSIAPQFWDDFGIFK
ncbi:hypothetical protein IPJ91_03165 [bacterium]|nr:MAG: hypothetical protein IPJ91_03165 [bacterium]